MINKTPRAPWLKDERVDWDVYNETKFPFLIDYLPAEGEGETLATQLSTCANKLIYTWYNDFDVYDNNFFMEGWLNDLSSYANWLCQHIYGMTPILQQIQFCHTKGEYEQLLLQMAKLAEESIGECHNIPKQGTIYDCDGIFRYTEPDDDNEEY